MTLWVGGDHGLCIFRIYPNSASTKLPIILMRMFYQVPKIRCICSCPLDHRHQGEETGPGCIWGPHYFPERSTASGMKPSMS